jgi:hypothetical protein
MISCVMGTFLPFFFMLVKVEPANAGPTMQVKRNCMIAHAARALN